MHPFETIGSKLWFFTMNLCVPQSLAKVELHPEGMHAKQVQASRGAANVLLHPVPY